MESIIRFALSNFTLTFFAIGIIVSFIVIIMRSERNYPFIIETILSYFILFSIGVSFFYNFVMHVFFGEMSAAFIGWADSPFQTEVGYASLGFSLIGFIAFRGGFDVRLAAVTGITAFLWGAAAGHIGEIVYEGNFAPGNAGVILYTDILLPVFGFVLLGLQRSFEQKR